MRRAELTPEKIQPVVNLEEPDHARNVSSKSNSRSCHPLTYADCSLRRASAGTDNGTDQTSGFSGRAHRTLFRIDSQISAAAVGLPSANAERWRPAQSSFRGRLRRVLHTLGRREWRLHKYHDDVRVAAALHHRAGPGGE